MLIIGEIYRNVIEKPLGHIPYAVTDNFFLFSSHIPSRHEREVSEFRKLEREKSFDEARTAVQSQIEKIFMKTAAAAANNAGAKNAKGVKNNVLTATNNARLSRRDQDQEGKVKKHPPLGGAPTSSSAQLNRGGAGATKRVTSMETKKVSRNQPPVKPKILLGPRRTPDSESWAASYQLP